MKKFFIYIKNKLTLLVAIALASIVGGATTAIVMASIPDGSGVVHGCYKNSTGMLKIIDSSTTTCSGSETSLNWNQTGPQGPAGTAISAYGFISCNGTPTCVLDSSHSGGISGYTQVGDETTGTTACMTVNFTPHAILENSGSYGGTVTYTFKDSAGNWAFPEQVQYSGQCDNIPGANIAMAVPFNDTRGVEFVVY